MARNEEKAQSMLSRWLRTKADFGEKKEQERRPYLASKCDTVIECEKWRRQILKEIGQKVALIQNASLGEHKIRELNDEINKLIREKGHWERRIIELNGPDYTKVRDRIFDADGAEVRGGRGYKYFGAAKNLPGVRELFEKKQVEEHKRTRHDMYKAVDADYYGYRDEDDGLLEQLEAEAEKKAIEEAVEQWKELQAKKKATGAVDALDFITTEEEEKGFVAHVAVPTREEVEKMILEKRKQEILKKYLGNNAAAAANQQVAGH